jgi:hypothetical protein
MGAFNFTANPGLSGETVAPLSSCGFMDRVNQSCSGGPRPGKSHTCALSLSLDICNH